MIVCFDARYRTVRNQNDQFLCMSREQYSCSRQTLARYFWIHRRCPPCFPDSQCEMTDPGLVFLFPRYTPPLPLMVKSDFKWKTRNSPVRRRQLWFGLMCNLMPRILYHTEKTKNKNKTKGLPFPIHS